MPPSVARPQLGSCEHCPGCGHADDRDHVNPWNDDRGRRTHRTTHAVVPALSAVIVVVIVAPIVVLVAMVMAVAIATAALTATVGGRPWGGFTTLTVRLTVVLVSAVPLARPVLNTAVAGRRRTDAGAGGKEGSTVIRKNTLASGRMLEVHTAVGVGLLIFFCSGQDLQMKQLLSFQFDLAPLDVDIDVGVIRHRVTS